MQRVILTLALLAASGLGAESAAQTPRYKHTLGDHTVYRRVVRTTGAGGGVQTRVQQLQYWTLQTGKDSQMLAELTEVVEQRGRCVGGLVMQGHRRGLRPLDPLYTDQLNELAPLLEPWPEWPEALRTSNDWQIRDAFGRTFRYQRAREAETKPGETAWTRRLVDDGFAAVQGQRYEGTLWFDTRRGLVTRIEGTWRDARTGRDSEVRIELFQREKTEADWRDRRGDELRRYQMTLGLQARYIDRMLADPEQADRLLADIGRFWSEQALQLARAEGPIRRLVNERRTSWEAGLAGWQERVRQVVGWRDIQAPRWALRDADERDVANRDFAQPILEILWSPLAITSALALQEMTDLRQKIPTEKLAIICIHLHGDQDALKAAGAFTGPGIVHLRPPKPALDEGLRIPIARLRSADGRIEQVSFGPRPLWRKWLEDWMGEEE